MVGRLRVPVMVRKTPGLPVVGTLMGMVVNPRRPETKTRRGVLTGRGIHPQNPSIPDTLPGPGTPHQKPALTRNTTPNNLPARSTRNAMVRNLRRGM